MVALFKKFNITNMMLSFSIIRQTDNNSTLNISTDHLILGVPCLIKHLHCCFKFSLQN